MNRISDEILNKFIDNELDQATYKMVKQQLDNSEPDRKRLKALQVVHKEMREMKGSQVSKDFTNVLMKKILRRAKSEKEQKVFVFSISSVFALVSLAIVGYFVYLVFTTGGGPQGAGTIAENTANFLQSIFDPVKNFLTNRNITIIGSIFSIGLLITIYFIVEAIKHSRHNLSGQH